MARYRPYHMPQASPAAPDLLNSPTLEDSHEEVKEKEKEPRTTYEIYGRDPDDTVNWGYGVEPAAHLPETALQSTETEKLNGKKPQLREDGTEYPGGIKLHLIMLAVCLAVFLMALE